MKRALLLSLWLVCAACANQSQPSAIEGARSSAGDYVRSIELAHQLADRAVEPNEARRLLERARDEAVPATLPAEDRRRVLSDLQFRLAVLALDTHEPARALQEAKRGLSHGLAVDVFTANLRIVEARAQEGLGARADAARAYADAMTIHERLLDDALRAKP